MRRHDVARASRRDACPLPDLVRGKKRISVPEAVLAADAKSSASVLGLKTILSYEDRAVGGVSRGLKKLARILKPRFASITPSMGRRPFHPPDDVARVTEECEQWDLVILYPTVRFGVAFCGEISDS